MSDYKSKIAYQGEPGAYSHLACKTAYPDLTPVPCESFSSAFASVENRETALAMIPIENSLGGRVADIHHLPVPSTDTAGSAREIKDLNDPTQGAIASSLAGEIYGLDVLRERVEDRLGNTTRFIVLSATRSEPDPQDGPCMTSFTFKVRSVPAALYKSLGGFATCGVNITKLESYIIDERFQVAQFYAEIEGVGRVETAQYPNAAG